MKLVINHNSDDIVLILSRKELPGAKLYPALNNTGRKAFRDFISTLSGALHERYLDNRRSDTNCAETKHYLDLIKEIEEKADHLCTSEMEAA